MTTPCHILVTGARGFVGAAVRRRALDAGHRVTSLSRAAPKDATWIEVDQLDPSAFASAVQQSAPDVIIDAAGITPSPGQTDFSSNVTLTENCLIASAACSSAPRVVSVGSAAVFGAGAPQERATREDDPMRPFSDYGRSKLEVLQLCKDAAQGGQDVQTGIVFNLMGPGQGAHLVPRVIIDRCKSGPHPIKVGSTAAVRDFLDIDDAADALLALAERGEPGDVVNIASGIPTRIGDLFDDICARFDTSWTSDADQTDRFVCYGDPARLRDITGWTPTHDLGACIDRAIAAADPTSKTRQQRELTS